MALLDAALGGCRYMQFHHTHLCGCMCKCMIRLYSINIHRQDLVDVDTVEFRHTHLGGCTCTCLIRLYYMNIHGVHNRGGMVVGNGNVWGTVGYLNLFLCFL